MTVTSFRPALRSQGSPGLAAGRRVDRREPGHGAVRLAAVAARRSCPSRPGGQILGIQPARASSGVRAGASTARPSGGLRSSSQAQSGGAGTTESAPVLGGSSRLSSPGAVPGRGRSDQGRSRLPHSVQAGALGQCDVVKDGDALRSPRRCLGAGFRLWARGGCAGWRFAGPGMTSCHQGAKPARTGQPRGRHRCCLLADTTADCNPLRRSGR